MNKIKFLFIAIALALLLLAFAFKLIPETWEPFIFMPTVAFGLIPMLQEIYRTVLSKKIDLGIPVFITTTMLIIKE